MTTKTKTISRTYTITAHDVSLRWNASAAERAEFDRLNFEIAKAGGSLTRTVVTEEVDLASIQLDGF